MGIENAIGTAMTIWVQNRREIKMKNRQDFNDDSDEDLKRDRKRDLDGNSEAGGNLDWNQVAEKELEQRF